MGIPRFVTSTEGIVQRPFTCNKSSCYLRNLYIMWWCLSVKFVMAGLTATLWYCITSVWKRVMVCFTSTGSPAISIRETKGNFLTTYSKLFRHCWFSHLRGHLQRALVSEPVSLQSGLCHGFLSAEAGHTGIPSIGMGQSCLQVSKTKIYFWIKIWNYDSREYPCKATTHV